MKLGDHVDLLTGFPFKSAQFSDDVRDIRLVKGVNVGQGDLRWDRTDYWPVTERSDYAKYELEAGDVILAMDRPWVEAGLKQAVVTERDLPALLLQRVARLRGANGLSTGFLRYLISSRAFSNYIQPIVTGVNVPHISPDQIRGFTFDLPPEPVQHRVAAVLAAYDELIENNLRRIEILEEMAQAVYREWFVNFRFPGHEDVALVDSPLGPIPEGWGVVSLAELAEKLVDGDWIETKDQGGSDYRLLQVSNVGVGRFRETGNFRYVTQSTFERLRCTEIRIGDILISRMPDPVGRSWLVDHLPKPAVTAVDVAILTPIEAAVGMFLEQHLNAPATLAHVASVATGTTRLRVTRRVLAQMRLVQPSDDLLEQFGVLSHPNQELRSKLNRQINTLRETCDLLLPKLVSGEIDVSDLDIDTEWLAS